MPKKESSKGIEKEMSFEAALEKLNEITEKLENFSVSLDKSVDLFKEGVELSLYCEKKLSEAESEIKILTETLEGKFNFSDFEVELDFSEEV